MNDSAVIDFSREMPVYQQAVRELFRLARQTPDGLARLQRFQAAQAQDLIAWDEEIAGHSVMLVVRPAAPVVDLIIELRHGLTDTKGAKA